MADVGALRGQLGRSLDVWPRVTIRFEQSYSINNAASDIVCILWIEAPWWTLYSASRLQEVTASMCQGILFFLRRMQQPMHARFRETTRWDQAACANSQGLVRQGFVA